LRRTMDACQRLCEERGIAFEGRLVHGDFIDLAVSTLRPSLFTTDLMASLGAFTAAIVNPPYLKINSASHVRGCLRSVGVEASNLYTAFMALSIKLLEPGGELVSITPRSFCNGPYFKHFRHAFLGEMTLRRLHLFESRQAAFRDDAVLQENVILAARKGRGTADTHVTISTSAGPADDSIVERHVPYTRVVHPGDQEAFIRIVERESGDRVAELIAACPASLADLQLSVSTGRVVDFRSKPHLRDHPSDDSVPLIYPTHLAGGKVSWPKLDGRKPNAIVLTAATRELLLPTGNYVLVKRFSAKEERKRVVAVLFEPGDADGELIGLENHLNYFHRAGSGFDLSIARGLATFLNSSLVDTYFRQFNGHTQVNATDLRNLRYPSQRQLRRLDAWLAASNPAPDAAAIEDFILEMIVSTP
jgi:adenine-specific DNA-methyltransferase